jgi:glyoxylase-like metal-dependent hydrolase (beta-lactamase superfamily II)
MIPVHTPGHAKDHTVFFLPEKGVLFSGDLYLADHIKFFRSDKNMWLPYAKRLYPFKNRKAFCLYLVFMSNSKRISQAVWSKSPS